MLLLMHINMLRQEKYLIYNYSNVIFSSLLGVLIFSEIPDLLSFIGYGFIIIAGYLIFRFGKEKQFSNKTL